MNAKKKYGQMMLENVGSMDSKMSMVSCCLYYQTICKDADFVLLLKKISKVEWKHLSIFCKLAFQLGMDPRLWSCSQQQNEYWSPSYVNYYQEIDQIIHYLIDRETKMIQIHQNQITQIKSQKLQSILEKIIKEEQNQIELIKTYKN